DVRLRDGVGDVRRESGRLRDVRELQDVGPGDGLYVDVAADHRGEGSRHVLRGGRRFAARPGDQAVTLRIELAVFGELQLLDLPLGDLPALHELDLGRKVVGVVGEPLVRARV